MIVTSMLDVRGTLKASCAQHVGKDKEREDCWRIAELK